MSKAILPETSNFEKQRTPISRSSSLRNAAHRQHFAEDLFWSVCPVSEHAKNTVNPIRQIAEALSVAPNLNKPVIKLHLGDPTLNDSLPACPAVSEALHFAVRSYRFNGYGPSVGLAEAREAIAQHFTHPKALISADDVILTSGCSHALQMAIEALADPGDNILVPSPGFPLYSTLMRPHGIQDRFYRLDMDEDAQVDLDHLESLIDSRTRAIIINNPSNPTGAVFTRRHLEDILRIAFKQRVPIIADEIYGSLTYNSAEFIPMATLEPKVPMITCDGISKRYLVPGWRLGWMIIHDSFGALREVRKGLFALSQKIVGPSAVIQGALSRILNDTPPSFFEHIRTVLSANANAAYERLKRVEGLKPVRPSGAMYMMIGIDEELLGDETSFVQGLIAEESVYCLPGSAFHAKNWFRIVLTYQEDVTVDACQRISDFCSRRLKAMRRLALSRCLDSEVTSARLLSNKLQIDDLSSEISESESFTSESD